MSYSLYVFFGLAPSFIWLLFYLHKDARPEPKKMILKVFLWGVLAGPAALGLQLLIRWLSQSHFNWSQFLASLSQHNIHFFLNVLLFAPLTEELLKYLVVRWQVLRNPAFDEPLDAMLYLIISALGFAAIENLLNIFLMNDLGWRSAASLALARFVSATFLHTLTSGLLGYFLARSLLNLKNRKVILLSGLCLAIVFHSFYNYLIWIWSGNGFIALGIATLLIGLAGLVSWQFRLLSKQLAICKIDLSKTKKSS